VINKNNGWRGGLSHPILAYGTTWPEGKVFCLRDLLFLKTAGVILLIQASPHF